jgi:hypothetical protein
MISVKRFIALFAAFCLSVSPAFAGITQIVGTGTGGNIGAAGSNTASQTVTIATSGAVSVPTGSLVVVTVGYRGTTTTGCKDNANNTSFTAGTNFTAGGWSVQVYYYIVGATAYTSGTTTITCTAGAAQNMAIIASAWSGAAATPYDVGATANATSVAPNSVGPTATLACNTTAGELVIGSMTNGSGVAFSSEGSGFTSMGTLASQQETHSAYQIVNSNAAVTYAPSYAASSTWLGRVDTFKATSCVAAAGKGGLLLTGVGR